jgi:putative ABC transport system permease protein
VLTVRDLLFRRRQFVIAILGAALVLGMALVMSGMSESFREEVRRTVNGVGADRWLVAEGASGPTTTFSALPTQVADELEQEQHVRADPLIFMSQSTTIRDATHTVNVLAHELGGLGTPEVVDGRAANASHEAVTDSRLGADLGDTMVIGDQTFTIVGHTSGSTMFGGIANVYLPIGDLQAIVFRGAPLATSIAVKGDLKAVAPSGFKVMTNDEVRADALRPMGDAIESVDTTRLFMWAVAAVIVAGLMFVSALERVRDFAVLKAMGASSAYLFRSVAIQAVVVALLAAAIGSAVSKFLVPLFSLPVAIPRSAFVILPVIAAAVGLLSSLAGLRRAVSADPALAFSGAK